MSGKIANHAFRGVKYLMISNIFQRLCTFTLNQMMVRYSGPEVFGLAAVELELLLSTLLFLSRFDRVLFIAICIDVCFFYL